VLYLVSDVGIMVQSANTGRGIRGRISAGSSIQNYKR